MGGPSSSQGQSPKTALTPAQRRQQEVAQLDFEIEFFQAVLERYPEYVDVLRVLGNALTLRGRFAEGLEVDKRLTQLRPQEALAHYNLACSHSLLHQVDAAFAALRRAIELGYDDFAYMERDSDLDNIRSDPRYRKLLLEYARAKQAKKKRSQQA
ncbi:MAG TPA: hypothetical protein PKD86_02560 [Gemmatales bacterium]|nr:hypothetical protein [Gemmatales bacterium]HMP58213.1 hypothetical protein [Gemmatales bacterium]